MSNRTSRPSRLAPIVLSISRPAIIGVVAGVLAAALVPAGRPVTSD